MVFLKDQYAADLGDYHGEGIGYILDKIRLKQNPANGNSSTTAETNVTRSKRHQTLPQPDKWTLLLATSAPVMPTPFEVGLREKPSEPEPLESLYGSSKVHKGPSFLDTKVPSFMPGHSRADVDPLSVGLARVSRRAVNGFSGLFEPRRKRYIRQARHKNDQDNDFVIARVTRTPVVGSRDEGSSSSSRGFVYTEPDSDAAAVKRSAELASESVVVRSHDNEEDEDYEGKADGGDHHLTESFTIKNTYAEKLLKIAHILHYGSIAILGIFVIQVTHRIHLLYTKFCVITLLSQIVWQRRP